MKTNDYLKRQYMENNEKRFRVKLSYTRQKMEIQK